MQMIKTSTCIFQGPGIVMVHLYRQCVCPVLIVCGQDVVQQEAGVASRTLPAELDDVTAQGDGVGWRGHAGGG